MELYGANIVQMSQQSEQASPELVVPHFDFVVITARHDQRLRAMEINTANRSIMLFKFVEHGSHSIVPQLNLAVVQGRQDPGAHRVEAQALHAVAFALKLSQHFVHIYATDHSNAASNSIAPRTIAPGKEWQAPLPAACCWVRCERAASSSGETGKITVQYVPCAMTAGTA